MAEKKIKIVWYVLSFNEKKLKNEGKRPSEGLLLTNIVLIVTTFFSTSKKINSFNN